MKFQRIKVVECEPRAKNKIWIRFEDGLSGEVDLEIVNKLLQHLANKGVFRSWNSDDFFNSVHISKSSTVAWGDEDEIDLDPYVLYDELKSKLS